jgi:hypothetical protein
VVVKGSTDLMGKDSSPRMLRRAKKATFAFNAVRFRTVVGS